MRPLLLISTLLCIILTVINLGIAWSCYKSAFVVGLSLFFTLAMWFIWWRSLDAKQDGDAQ